MTDLDARVAALMHIIDSNVSNLEFAEFEQLEQAIRAELQKPALHEPVTDAESDKAERRYMVNGWRMGNVLESFLQGRAKPAQEEITDAVTDAMVEAYLKEQRRTVEESDRLFGRPNVGGLKTGTVQEACRNGLIAAIRASKGEKT